MSDAWRINMHERLVRNTDEPALATGCWAWVRKKDAEGYAQINVWVPGLHKTFTMKAHILMWLLVNIDAELIRDADDAYLAYKEITVSGLHLDHLCAVRSCINPDHLEPVSPKVNMERRDARRSAVRTLDFCPNAIFRKRQ